MAEDSLPVSVLALHPVTGGNTAEFGPSRILELFDHVKVGRCINTKTEPLKTNAYFNNATLSRVHAEVWADLKTHQVFVKDLGSSNGTFLNGQRLSEEGVTSQPFVVEDGQCLTFGMDMLNDIGERTPTLFFCYIRFLTLIRWSAIHRKITANVRIARPGQSIQAITEPPVKIPETPAKLKISEAPAKTPASQVSFVIKDLENDDDSEDSDSGDDMPEFKSKAKTSAAPLLMMTGTPQKAAVTALAALKDEEEDDLFNIKSTLLDDLSPIPSEPAAPAPQANTAKGQQQKAQGAVLPSIEKKESVLKDEVAEKLIAKLEVLFLLSLFFHLVVGSS